MYYEVICTTQSQAENPTAWRPWRRRGRRRGSCRARRTGRAGRCASAARWPPAAGKMQQNVSYWIFKHHMHMRHASQLLTAQQDHSPLLPQGLRAQTRHSEGFT